MIFGDVSVDVPVKGGEFPTLMVEGDAPLPLPSPSLCGIAAREADQNILNWVALLAWIEVRSRRYKDLYAQHFGSGEQPTLNVLGVDV